MKYKPNWLKIIFLAVIFNFFVFSALASFFLVQNINQPENLIELSWVDVQNVKISNSPPPELINSFPEINLPPLEIPKIALPALPELKNFENSPEFFNPPTENISDEISQKIFDSPAENNSDENSQKNLIAIVKIYPKDLIDQLVAGGAVNEKIVPDNKKIILSITVGVDGKVKNAEIIEGGGNDERGKILNFVSQVAASSWIFEPFLDENGHPIEFKTQIEFFPEDF